MKKIKAPKRIEFLPEDQDGLIRFLRKLLRYKDEHIIIDVSSTESISEGGFLALKAQVEKAAIGSIRKKFIINRPKSKKVLEFLKAQFFEHRDVSRAEFHVSIAGNKDIAMDSVTDPALVDKMVLGLKKIGITEYYDPFYDFLVELIGNATEHGIKNKNINWWLIHYRDKQSKSLRYVFVDMGIGIVGSHKKAGLPFTYWFSSDRRIIRAAMEGKLGSSTKQDNRGNGLPFVRDIVEKRYLSDFMLVSNGVMICEKEGKLVYSRNDNFVGTYYSWSINKENVKLWMSSRL